MSKSSQIKSDGTLKVFGELDEVTQNTISESATYLRAAEFDEVTLNPLTNGLVKRQTADGRILVANIFDEVNVLVTRGIKLLLDAEDTASYSGSGSTWYDISGNGADISLVNSPSFTNVTPKYFSFNGSNQYGTGSTAVLGTSNYTKQVWFQLGSYAYNNNILSSSSGGHFLFFSGTSTVYPGHSDFGNYNAFGSTVTFSLNQWYNIAVTFDVATGFILYINGEQNNTFSWTTALPGNGYVDVAAYDNGNFLNGKIAHGLGYNVTLTATEVKQNYDATKSRFGF